jgi:hypothetical protein
MAATRYAFETTFTESGKKYQFSFLKKNRDKRKIGIFMFK